MVTKPTSNIYETDATYPSVIFKRRKPQFLNGVKVVLVDLMPFLYNPVRGPVEILQGTGSQNHNKERKQPGLGHALP